MFKKEKLDQADEGLPPLDFPLDQFDLALFFKSDLSKITVELDDSGFVTYLKILTKFTNSEI